MLLSNKGYTPKILGTCGHIFALEKVVNQNLPFNDKQGLIQFRFYFLINQIICFL